MPLDENNRAYILKCDSQNREYRVTPEEAGWHKTLLIKGIFGKEKFFKKIRSNRTVSGAKTFEAWVYREYIVKAGTCSKCQELLDAGAITESMDRLKRVSPKTPCFRKCFLGKYGSDRKGDLTMLVADWDNSKSWILKKEEPLTSEQVIERFLKGEIDFISDYSLISEIERRTGRTF
jgi:hypothetical protein